MSNDQIQFFKDLRTAMYLCCLAVRIVFQFGNKITNKLIITLVINMIQLRKKASN